MVERQRRLPTSRGKQTQEHNTRELLQEDFENLVILLDAFLVGTQRRERINLIETEPEINVVLLT